MIFAELPLADCENAILAHSQRAGGEMFRKGRVLSAQDIDRLRQAGLATVTVARLEAGDVAEDAAAEELAAALVAHESGLVGERAFTGRVNLHAEAGGVLVLDEAAIDAVNAIDEAITLATLPPFAALETGQMAATIKIIPYAVPRRTLDEALAAIRSGTQAPLRLHPYLPRRLALIQTELPGIKPSVLDKTERVMAARLAAMGQAAPASARCAHEIPPLRAAIDNAIAAGAGMVLVVGASAISDRRDVIPTAIVAAGGTLDHFGMPVDPGNLLLLAHIGAVPVLGLPGCARSPRPNGCDWVMQRLLAGLTVGPADIRALGIGGLLAEIPSRPQPREAPAPMPGSAKIAAIVLAAGRSSRMGRNKLLLDLDGKPILRHVVDQALAAGLADIVVVTGHQAGKVKDALADTPVRLIEARDHAEGMAASLKAGIRALDSSIDAVLVLLGDMPQVSPALMRTLMRAYNPIEGRAIVLPVAEGKRGNPVLFDRRFFTEILALDGDVGARHIIGGNAEWVAEIPAEAREIFVDVDTPEAYRRMLAERQA
ncbi:MAG: molybdopterin-binding/glycosyltransferase family 2 protein [Rhodospirillaceae bacterium]|nr:molybdopterin-binding/glycosyltransferase family 2 protein [Rhodospirillaceae bacterium]